MADLMSSMLNWYVPSSSAMMLAVAKATFALISRISETGGYTLPFEAHDAEIEVLGIARE